MNSHSPCALADVDMMTIITETESPLLPDR